MAVAVERRPVRWTTGTSSEPFAALLLRGPAFTTIVVNERVATTPWHDAVIEAWAAINADRPYAVLAAIALGLSVV